MSFNWTCPYCNRPQTVTDVNFHSNDYRLRVGKSAEGPLSLASHAITCVNEGCRRTQINVYVGPTNLDVHGNIRAFDFDQKMNFSQRIMPQGNSKPQPDYIPKALRDDYSEACLIKDLSPKASATLVRRCLQGIIRDFTGISAKTLFHEIGALRKAVDDGSADRAIAIETVDAIDQVRGIGNIGAHMEKDINHIIDVEPDEASTLIELVEMLFEEWYIARHNRQQKLASIAGIAQDKEEAKKTKSEAVNALLPPQIDMSNK